MATFGSNRRIKQTSVIGPYGIFLILVAHFQFVDCVPTFTTTPKDKVYVTEGQSLTLPWGYNADGQTVTQVELLYTQNGGGDELIIARKYPGQALQILAASGYTGRISFSGDATFTISNIVKNDSRTYECKVSFTDINNPQIKDFVEVIVVVAAKLTNVSGDQTVLEGSDMQLVCEATGKPTPNITWTRVPDSNSEVLHRGPTWNFANINRTASGTYHCTAYNGFGKQASQEVRVNVTYPPSITSDGHTIDVTKGSAASIPCPVVGNPQPNITWYKGNDTSTEVIYRGTLEFPDTTLNHSGWYTCFAENNLGNVTVSINLLVAKPSTTTTSSTPTTEEGKNNDIIILGAVLGSVALLVVVAAVVIGCCVYKKRKCKRKDTKVHSNDPQEALENDQEGVYAQANDAYADIGPRSNPNNRAVNPSSVPPVTYDAVKQSVKTSAKKEKKGVVKEKPVAEYAVVDKSKQKKKEKKPKPGELQYAELGDFSKGQRIPNTSTSPANETQYADINQMI